MLTADLDPNVLAQANSPLQSRVPYLLSAPMAPQRPSVLVIDDDDAARRAVVRVLQPIAVVADVDCADAALCAIATGTVFDAVVVDVSRRRRAATELLEKLKRSHPELAARFVAITGADDVDEIRQHVLAVAGSADFAAE